jgi:gamma-glutamylcyclotransferase (GGCT)/AIG2-like uncharacterized protein YtfP
MKYFAYGMNTNIMSMAQRCPAAVPMGHAIIENYRFRFAVHADIVPEHGAYVDGVLWEVTDTCVESLDQTEGYPFYYDKRIVTANHNGKDMDTLVYVMVPNHPDSEPGKTYYQMCTEGYLENGIPTAQLTEALDNKFKPRYNIDIL